MAIKFFSGLFQDYFKKAVYDTLKAIVILLVSALGTYLGVKGLSSYLESIQPYAWHIAVFVGALITLITMIVWQRVRRGYPDYERMDPEFKIIEKEIYYEYKSESEMVYGKKLVLMALKDKLLSFTDKYNWSGSGNFSLRSLNPSHTIEFHKEKVSFWNLYTITFNQMLNKKDEITVEVEGNLLDPQKKALPFLSTTIDEPTNNLLIKLKLNPSLNVKDGLKEIWMNSGSKHLLKSEPVKFNSRGEVEWKISNPKLLHYYQIRWHMPDTLE